MDIRDLLIDGIEQLTDWMDGALKDLSAEQVNWDPPGNAVSVGFNAWHVMRTTDNIVNFVFKKTPPIWMAQGYVEKLGLPKVEQGTGMSLEDAHALTISNVELLRDYGRSVGADAIAFLKDVSVAALEEVQLIKPLGEMPKWRVVRQVIMTHGFMHLGEINALKGQLGFRFAI